MGGSAVGLEVSRLLHSSPLRANAELADTWSGLEVAPEWQYRIKHMMEVVTIFYA